MRRKTVDMPQRGPGGKDCYVYGLAVLTSGRGFALQIHMVGKLLNWRDAEGSRDITIH